MRDSGMAPPQPEFGGAPSGGTSRPLPSFTGGGGPSYNVAPNLVPREEERQTDLDEELTAEEYEETIAALRKQNQDLRGELRGGVFSPMSGGGQITKEGVAKFVAGDESDAFTLMVPTHKFLLAELELIREEVRDLINKNQQEIKDELKDLREVALPLLKMLSTLSKDDKE